MTSDPNSDETTPVLSPRDQADHDRSVHDYPDILFSPTEYVVIDVERSVLGLVQVWFFACLAFAAVIGITFLISWTAPTESQDEIAIIGFAAALGSFVGGAIATYVFRANYFIVTNERVFSRIQTSPFSQRSQNVELEHIEDCSYRQSGPIQMIFNYGSIRLSTVGDEQTYRFTFVTRPADQFKVINNVIQQVDEGAATQFRR
jgi:hypothetical protein